MANGADIFAPSDVFVPINIFGPTSREAVIMAVFDRLVSIVEPVVAAPFKTRSRKLKLWTDVPIESKPAIFLVDHDERTEYQSETTPRKLNMGCELFVYIRTEVSNESQVGSTILNGLLDAIDGALAPDPVTMKQTLGGLVSHCYIEGETLKVPGDIDGDGMLVVPIRILVPD